MALVRDKEPIVNADSLTVAIDETTPARVAVAQPAILVAPALPAPRTTWQRAKRMTEPVIAVLMLLALLPVLLVIALAVKLDSRGPVLFRQRRVGFRMREFPVLKFRTMAHNAPQELHRLYIAELVHGNGTDADGGLKKMVEDPRITRVGRFLRKTSLDELPQLFNVVAGQMSLVGPRPAIAYELEHYEDRHFRRFDVLPGLTGLWQVSGRNELDFHQMLDLDVRYVKESGAAADLQILVRTPITLVRRHAA
jgi:lipopolysaccharide/colanic/teichoic acid biosynthesis glycosyltransferase